jgi:5-methylcytosine-specific restriction endonuclease McrA
LILEKEMKKACPYCGKIHDKKIVCDKKPAPQRTRKANAKEDAFRWSYNWKLKREYIKRRDNYLCQACLHDLPGTVRRLNNEELSVHHITPLQVDFDKKLDDENLITLCRNHHEMAENGQISAETLLKILRNIPPEG